MWKSTNPFALFPGLIVRFLRLETCTQSIEDFMNRFRSILMVIMLLLPAAGAIAIAPGGTVDGTGGLNEKTPAVQGERSPARMPAAADVGMRAVENLEIPSTVDNFNPEKSDVKVSKDRKVRAGGNSAASVKPEAQHKKITRMNRTEKKAFRKRVKKNKKDIKDSLVKARKEKKSKDSNSSDTELLLLVILAILLPPLAVFLYEGSITINFWISLILTLIFWLPGIIFALVIILGGY